MQALQDSSHLLVLAGRDYIHNVAHFMEEKVVQISTSIERSPRNRFITVLASSEYHNPGSQNDGTVKSVELDFWFH